MQQIEIKVKNTRFIAMGIYKENKLWDIYLIDPKINYKEIIIKDMPTLDFSMVSSLTLKTPFPFHKIKL